MNVSDGGGHEVAFFIDQFIVVTESYPAITLRVVSHRKCLVFVL